MADDLMEVETTLESKKFALQRALEDYERAKKDQQSVSSQNMHLHKLISIDLYTL